MTKSFSASIRNWSEKAQRNANLVFREAVQTVANDMTERQPSVTETGTFKIGQVPVDTGNLIQSQIAQINGSTVATGEGADIDNRGVDYNLSVAGLEAGDTFLAGFTAEYGPYVESGTATMPGRFFVREAVLGWQKAVDDAAKKFKD